MLTLDSVLEIAPGIISRESDDELVVVLPGEGKFFVLNGTGAEVFRRIDGERTLSEIATTLHALHDDIDLKRAHEDVLAFTATILDRDAVRIVQ